MIKHSLEIINLVAGIILFLVINVIDLNFDIKIPYQFWLLLALGGGVLVIDFIANIVAFGSIIGTTLYWGGLLVALGGLLEWHLIPEKLDMIDSKFVLLVGCGMAIVVAILTLGIVWWIVTIGLCVLLILAIFDVAIPYEWWLTLGVGLAIFLLVHPASGFVLLVGYLLVQLDY